MVEVLEFPQQRTEAVKQQEDCATGVDIYPEFRDLLKPLTKEEKKTLEQSLISEGCKHPIELWNGYIIDGHNRYDICIRQGLDFKVVHRDKDFVDETDVKFWIRLNQLAGRNMTEGEKVYQVSLLKEDFEALAKESQGKRNDLLEKYEDYIKNFCRVPDSGLESKKEQQDRWNENRVSSKLAKLAGVSRDKMEKYEAIKKIGSVKDILEIREGKKKINPTYDNLRRMHRVEEAKKEFPGEDYEVVYANLYEIDKNSPNCFKLSRTIEKINSIPVKEFTACQALALLWSPINFVDRTIDIMKTWGFKYQTAIYFEPKEYSGLQNTYSALHHGLLLVGSKNGYVPRKPINLNCFFKNGLICHLEEFLIREVAPVARPEKVISISPLEGKSSEWDQYQEQISQ
jgi:hypothetical protein